MHPTKQELLNINGPRCMLCGKIYPLRELQWHHIVPKYVTTFMGRPPDNSYENGSILCLKCHARVHEYLYWDDEYQFLTDVIEDNKI